MQERLRNMPKQMLGWWNKFSVKQKTLIASICLVVVVALGILGKVLTTPTMVPIRTCDNTKEAGEVKQLLDGEGIKFDVSSDGLSFSVKAQDEADAAILLGANGIPASGYDINNVFEGGFSNTEADKAKKYQLYLEDRLAKQLEMLDTVDSATVKLSMPVDDGTVLALEEDTYAAVKLSLSEEVDEEWASGLAKWIATAIGNDNTDDVSIMDSSGEVLFLGGDTSTTVGVASGQLSYRAKAENMVKSQVKDVILGTGVYDSASVGLNLDINFDEREETDNNYYTPEGTDRGPVSSERLYDKEASGGDGGVPGTDTNDGDDTTYVFQDGAYNNETISESDRKYNTSQRVTTTKGGVEINPENSSITVVANQNMYYSEAALRASGELDDMTFDEFVAANRDKVKLDVDQDFVQMVAMATGIAAENIVIVAYQVPFFEYDGGGSQNIMDYLPIIIAVIIMLMLGYVVFRSTRKEQVLVEEEPELSVESLLASTKEAEDSLEDIGFSEKSETRVLIEKFVDENPEAVASLLRNWLNEEWE
ncbi:MAG: flagellar biosynthesis protein [Lachnospiraceae bacterium]|nr:flagellar biosynthesis protein [Lachnospiraceae bacterium]